MLWTDNRVIPAYARHKANAERLMNFHYRPEVAAQLTAYERYICPVLGTQAAMQKVDPALCGATHDVLRAQQEIAAVLGAVQGRDQGGG
jgi:spermidine/putrescine transport system substrate-binding protein